MKDYLPTMNELIKWGLVSIATIAVVNKVPQLKAIVAPQTPSVQNGA